MDIEPNTTVLQAEDPMVLVCAADDNYVMPLAAVIRSVLENLSQENNIKIFIIDGGIHEHNKLKLEKSTNSKTIQIKWLSPIKTIFENIEVSAYYTKAIFYRLLIPELLKEYRKAIYLDSDVVVNTDLKKLWDIDMEDQYILAAPDLYPSPLLSTGYIAFTKSTGFYLDRMFNSGVMVINLEKWRSDEIATKALQYISQYKLLDQEALNVVLKNNWKEIHPLWNRTGGIYEYKSWDRSPFTESEFDDLLNNPYIIHFTSSAKPWNSINICPEELLFYKYLDATDWSGWRFTQWKRIKRKIHQELNKMRKALFVQ